MALNSIENYVPPYSIILVFVPHHSLKLFCVKCSLDYKVDPCDAVIVGYKNILTENELNTFTGDDDFYCDVCAKMCIVGISEWDGNPWGGERYEEFLLYENEIQKFFLLPHRRKQDLPSMPGFETCFE